MKKKNSNSDPNWILIPLVWVKFLIIEMLACKNPILQHQHMLKSHVYIDRNDSEFLIISIINTE